MADEHPLEQLLRDAKERDDVKAAALIAEQRQAFDLQEQVRSQWVRTKAGLLEEIGRANAVLEKHNLPERFALRDLPEAGAGNIARCNLALAYPSKSARAEYDLTVLASDGRMILLHRATGQRHQKLTVFTASGKGWETTLTGLFADHLKKGRDTSQPSPEPAPTSTPSVDPEPVAARKSP
jgi:hypothetical protein